MDDTERVTIINNVELYMTPIGLKWNSLKALWNRCKSEHGSMDDWSLWFRQFENIIESLDYIRESMAEALGEDVL